MFRVCIKKIFLAGIIFCLLLLSTTNVYARGGGGGGGGGGGIGGGFYGVHGSSGFSCRLLSSVVSHNTCNTIINGFGIVFIGAIGILLLWGVILILYKKVDGIIRRNKSPFTQDFAVIAYVKKIVPLFNNWYGPKYTKDSAVWVMTKPKKEIQQSAYQDSITRDQLIEHTKKLFFTYQDDWMHKRFNKISSYVIDPFNKQQQHIFKRMFHEGFDIIYNPEILSITPIKVIHEKEGLVCRVQINARMVNFEVAPDGTVKSGEAYPRKFTEFWTIIIDNKKQFFLKNITQYYLLGNPKVFKRIFFIFCIIFLILSF